jgi:hypothetical protein
VTAGSGERVMLCRRRPVACPTCKRSAIRLIIPWWADGGDWRTARCNRCAGDRAFDTPEYRVHYETAMREG